MKLATYKDGSRDGQLVVVSRDLSTAHYATGIANKMQQVLDDWGFIAPQLVDLYETINLGKARHAFPFDPAMCMAPLPRAYQWADGSAYINHVELVRAARGAEVPSPGQAHRGRAGRTHGGMAAQRRAARSLGHAPPVPRPARRGGAELGGARGRH